MKRPAPRFTRTCPLFPDTRLFRSEAGEEVLGHRRAAGEAGALQHPYLQPGAGEVGGADQAVVAAADDEDVAACRAHSPIVGASEAAAGSRSLFRCLQCGPGTPTGSAPARSARP